MTRSNRRTLSRSILALSLLLGTTGALFAPSCDDAVCDVEDNAGCPDGQICATDGSGATQLAAGASLLGTYLGADADSLYTDGKVGAYEGLVAAAKADGALTPLIKGGAASPTAFTSTLGVDKENVYYMTVDSAAGWQVQAVPKAGGTPTVIGLGSQFDLGIDQMAQDDNNLYLLHNWHEILLLPKKPGDPKGL